jgi:hypothetical protein
MGKKRLKKKKKRRRKKKGSIYSRTGHRNLGHQPIYICSMAGSGER